MTENVVVDANYLRRYLYTKQVNNLTESSKSQEVDLSRRLAAPPSEIVKPDGWPGL